ALADADDDGLQARRVGQQRRRVAHDADVDGTGGQRLVQQRAGAELGELDLVGQVVELAGELEGELEALPLVADAQHGAGRDLPVGGGRGAGGRAVAVVAAARGRRDEPEGQDGAGEAPATGS